MAKTNDESLLNRTLAAADEVSQARQRVPIAGQRDKIKFKNLDQKNFYYRLIDITNPDRVDRFMAAGYSFVTGTGSLKDIVGPDVTPEVRGSIVTVRGGGGVILGLVALPMNLYLEDLAAKEKEIKKWEDETKRELRKMADRSQGGWGEADFGHEAPRRKL